jgi:branched-chain amino acid transport system substrate-binding protein
VPTHPSNGGTMRRSIYRWVIAGLAISLLAAACSSSKSSSTTPTTGSSSSPTTAGGGGGPHVASNVTGNAGGGSIEALASKGSLTGPTGTGLTRGITGSTVTVGCVYTAQSFAGYNEALQSYFVAVNKAGGVNGRTINLIPCKDDNSTAQTNLQEVQQLVNQNNVFAIFSATQAILPGSTDFLNNNQVPFYGWGFLPGFCGTRWGFGWDGCLEGNAATKQQVPHAAIQGNLADAIIAASGLCPSGNGCSAVKVAVQSENSAAGKVGQAQYQTLFTQRGADVVYNQSNFPTTAGADVTPYTQAIIAAKPNIVEISTPFQDVGPIAAGLKSGGYTGIIFDFTNYVPGLLQASPQLAQAINNEYVNTQVVPQEQNTPWIQKEVADLTANGQKPFVTLGGAQAFAAGELFVESLQATGQTLNTKTFDQAVNGGSFSAFSSLSSCAVTGPCDRPGTLKFPAAHVLGADCAAIVQVQGTSYAVKEPFACYNSLLVF